MIMTILFKSKQVMRLPVCWVSNISTRFDGEDRLLFIPLGQTNDPRNRQSLPLSEISCVEVSENDYYNQANAVNYIRHKLEMEDK